MGIYYVIQCSSLFNFSKLKIRSGTQVTQILPSELESGACVAAGADSGAGVLGAGASVPAVGGDAGTGTCVVAAAKYQVGGCFRFMFGYNKRENQQLTYL